ncbi:tetratricopeptide repeat protein [Streptomyces sp. NPDC059452]|uniref:tetratricopeptide repeat protein n=1 Tax=Streptomyces sp. NPDC059452 TaxID=3346835 RepID=UPI00368D9AA5
MNAAADLFQPAGEVAFDGNRYADASASYALAASVSKDAQAYDLWACALLAPGQSYRRRGAVLTDLAAIGAKRRDAEQVVVYGKEAISLARASGSGYVARRFRGLCDEFGPMSRDHRVAELGAEIATPSTP